VKALGHARGIWIVAAAVVLVAGHGVILYYGSSQLELSATIVSSVAILVIAKHLGLIGLLRRLMRTRVSQSTAVKDGP
jgi:hypothetical protein